MKHIQTAHPQLLPTSSAFDWLRVKNKKDLIGSRESNSWKKKKGGLLFLLLF
jgi:hypothetical protein